MDQHTDAREQIANAWEIMARRDWDAALREWHVIMKRFPDQPSGYAGAANALRESGRLDAAEQLLDRVIRAFPTSSEIATSRGWIAHAKRDWEEATRRWADVRARFPESPSGYAGGGAALRELGRLDEAEAVLRLGVERLPDSSDIAVNFAWVAHARRDWEEALRRWNAVSRRFPDAPSASLGAAMALAERGRADEADRVLADGIRRWPSRADLASRYALLAQDRADWTEAARRWRKVLERFPANPIARRELATVSAHTAAPPAAQRDGGNSRRTAPEQARRRGAS